MPQTLDQIVSKHLPKEEAAALISALHETRTPFGRIALHSMRTKEQVEIVLGSHNNSSHAPIIHIGPDIPLDELVYVERDLEEEAGLLPTSWKAAEQPRIESGKYALFGVQDKKATTLFLIDKKRETELAQIPELHQLRTFETFRLFSDERDDTDLVTGLRSRTYFDRKVNNLARIGQIANYHLLAADLDQFKALNGRFGYAAGDLGLKIMGQELKRALGEDGLGSRRHYGDETMLIALKELFLEYPGGPRAWADDVNDRLKKRSREVFGDFTLKLTFGLYSLETNTDYDDAKRSADQALVYAKNNMIPIQEWRPDLPTHEDMQSGRYRKLDDPKLAAFGTAASRAFSPAILPEQVAGARDILEDIIHKSQPVRESGNQEVLATLAHHLFIANPRAMETFNAERVWESVYLARKNLGLLTPEEKELESDPSKISAYFLERLNLKHLFTTDAHKETYNNTLESYITCRYDDTIKNITAITDSQHQSRFIISGRDTPTTGELQTFGEILNLLTCGYHFEDKSGLITLYRADTPHDKTIIHFDHSRFDTSPIAAQLASAHERLINHFGLTDVDITVHDEKTPIPHYTFTAKKLEALEPLLWIADDKEHDSSRSHGRIRLFKRADGYGANIPQAAQLLLERARLDPAYAASLYHEPSPKTPWKDGSTSTRTTRRHITPESAPRLIRERYEIQGITSRGELPVFYAPLLGMVALLSDLYIARDIYLTAKNGTFTVNNLRVPDLETTAPRFEEIVTHFARTFNKLLHDGGKLLYTIERAQPRLTHKPEFVGLNQLAIPISARYGELFCK